MGRLKIHNSNIKREMIDRERELRFLSLSGEERFFELVKLNKLAVLMNGGKPLKVPHGNGIVIRRSAG
ncbi:hypothetical protein [Pedobacter agri]|uniref:hypothetical protein n=1 Tax=Pedobacter agri TaxID=454586 RepID=UPI002930E4AB|nr:hypothetical protein [Pedobacter agri]